MVDKRGRKRGKIEGEKWKERGKKGEEGERYKERCIYCIGVCTTKEGRQESYIDIVL